MTFKYRNYIPAVIMLLISAVLLSCSPPPAQQNTDKNVPEEKTSSLQTILERGTLRVGTTGDFNPMSFKDTDSGDYTGHDIELIEKLAEDMGVQVEWVATDWKNLVSGISSGKYDITTGASYNAGRAKSAGYSQSVVSVGTVPLTLKSNSKRFTSWEDIDESVSVAVTLGTVFEEQARQLFTESRIISVESPARDFQEVLAGRADVSITSNIEAANLVRTYPELVRIPVQEPVFANSIGLLMPQNDQIFINYVNVWLEIKRKSGYLEDLKTKWL